MCVCVSVCVCVQCSLRSSGAKPDGEKGHIWPQQLEGLTYFFRSTFVRPPTLHVSPARPLPQTPRPNRLLKTKRCYSAGLKRKRAEKKDSLSVDPHVTFLHLLLVVFSVVVSYVWQVELRDIRITFNRQIKAFGTMKKKISHVNSMSHLAVWSFITRTEVACMHICRFLWRSLLNLHP